MKRKLTAGSTSQSVPVFVQDSSSTTGAGLAGLTYSSSGLVCEYRRQGQATWTAISNATMTLGTWASGGFIADGSPAGAYELGLPDAVLAASAGVTWAVVRLYGAANMLPVLIEIELDAIGYQDGVRAGLTALPNAAANANGGLPILSSSGTTLAYTVSTVATVTNGVGIGPGAISTASFAAGAINAAAIAASALNGKGDWLLASGYTVPPTSAVIAAATWDLATSGHTTSGTFGAAAIAAGSAGDPWATSLPGAYGAGTAGAIVGARLDAAVSSRSTYAGADTAGTTTLLARLTSTRAGYLDNLSAGAVALAAQIPANFTTATFASAGVFSIGALANAPAGGGGGGGSDPWATAEPGSYGASTFGGLVSSTLTQLGTMLSIVGSGPDYRYTVQALANAPGGSGGSGSVAVNHDYPTAGNLTYTSFGGQGIGGATVRAYLQSEWAANPVTATVRGESRTLATGKWAAPMMLGPGAYTVAFFKADETGVDTASITVS